MTNMDADGNGTFAIFDWYGMILSTGALNEEPVFLAPKHVFPLYSVTAKLAKRVYPKDFEVPGIRNVIIAG